MDWPGIETRASAANRLNHGAALVYFLDYLRKYLVRNNASAPWHCSVGCVSNLKVCIFGLYQSDMIAGKAIGSRNQRFFSRQE
jgi:hypothetical protein